MPKLSKSDQSIEDQKVQQTEDIVKLRRLLYETPMTGQQPGDGCIIVLPTGEKLYGTYTETGWTTDANL
jgi:hypothetical protein